MAPAVRPIKANDSRKYPELRRALQIAPEIRSRNAEPRLTLIF